MMGSGWSRPSRTERAVVRDEIAVAWRAPMKPWTIGLVTVLAVSASSCTTIRDGGTNCTDLRIVYAGSVLHVVGYPEGLFSVENVGGSVAKLPMGGEVGNDIHGRYADIEQWSPDSEEWHMFSPQLEEFLSPTRNLTILPGQRSEFRYGANGLFLNPRPSSDMKFSIVVRDARGCTFRSATFQP